MHELDKDWRLYNLKDMLNVLKKYEGISEQKIVKITKSTTKQKVEVLVNAQVFYRNNDPSKKSTTLLKRGQTLKNMRMSKIEERPKLSVDKAKAVNKLLIASFGEDWRLEANLSYYFQVLSSNLSERNETSVEEPCLCTQEETELKT